MELNLRINVWSLLLSARITLFENELNPAISKTQREFIFAEYEFQYEQYSVYLLWGNPVRIQRIQ